MSLMLETLGPEMGIKAWLFFLQCHYRQKPEEKKKQLSHNSWEADGIASHDRTRLAYRLGRTRSDYSKVIRVQTFCWTCSQMFDSGTSTSGTEKMVLVFCDQTLASVSFAVLLSDGRCCLWESLLCLPVSVVWVRPSVNARLCL